MNLPLTCCPTMTDATRPGGGDCITWEPKPGGGWLLWDDIGQEQFYIRHCPWCGAKLPEEPKA